MGKLMAMHGKLSLDSTKTAVGTTEGCTSCSDSIGALETLILWWYF